MAATMNRTPQNVFDLARMTWPDTVLSVRECPLSAHPWTCWVVVTDKGHDLAFGETLDYLYEAVAAAKGK